MLYVTFQSLRQSDKPIKVGVTWSVPNHMWPIEYRHCRWPSTTDHYGLLIGRCVPSIDMYHELFLKVIACNVLPLVAVQSRHIYFDNSARFSHCECVCFRYGYFNSLLFVVYAICCPIALINTRKMCYRKDDPAMRPIYECLSCRFTKWD